MGDLERNGRVSGMSWNKNSNSGFKVENFLVNYLDEYYNWSFVAGNLNGKLVNKEHIENIFNCKVVEAVSKVKGQKIVFPDGEEALMPDLLFSSKNGYNFWVESKSAEDYRYDTIDIPVSLFKDYVKVKNRTNRTLWVVLSKKNCDESYNLYSTRIMVLNDFIERNEITPLRNKEWKVDVYRFSVELFQSLGFNISIN